MPETKIGGVPLQCYAGGAIGIGAITAATYLHEGTKIPPECVVTSLVGVGAVTAALAHHSKNAHSLPPWYCVAGVVGGVGGVVYAVKRHQDKHRDRKAPAIPPTCLAGTLAGLALLVAGTAFLARK
eukprot:GGOE01018474.1.p1 GENE.GGOE01018474.1~~GGOE01018474.1.p1  ORF type:complete len:139 (-),score=37.54 GGOE01018474.1:181-558(-)